MDVELLLLLGGSLLHHHLHELLILFLQNLELFGHGFLLLLLPGVLSLGTIFRVSNELGLCHLGCIIVLVGGMRGIFCIGHSGLLAELVLIPCSSLSSSSSAGS